MIRRLLRRLLGAESVETQGRQVRKIPVSEHGISRDQISPCAVKVTDELQKAGYAAFVVGGAVRDLMVGKTPKDYDVATDATPEQVKAVFRRSRIIGRRFRLVHVMCGPEIIEVSTFRGASAISGADASEDDAVFDESPERASDENGRILRDNVFGSQEEDALRRDFTVNALYYDPSTQEIWDYHDGVRDVRSGTLRMIGDPEQRFREDPVRMLRAVRFAAKLDCHIDPATREPVARLADLLNNVPSARLFDEMVKLLMSGHGLRGVHQLRSEGLHHGLLPLLDEILEQPVGEKFVTLALQSTDERVKNEKPVSPAFLFSCLLWHQVSARSQALEQEGEKPYPALFRAMDDVLRDQRRRLAIPRRFDAMIKEIWSLQPRFMQRSGARPYRLVQHPRFRAAYDFLLLRCESGELDPALGQWWDRFQQVGEADRKSMLVGDGGAAKPRRRRRRKSSRPDSAGQGSHGH